MPVKFLGADGTGSTAHAILALGFAIAHGAQIINCSDKNQPWECADDQALPDRCVAVQ